MLQGYVGVPLENPKFLDIPAASSQGALHGSVKRVSIHHPLGNSIGTPT